MVSPPTGVFMNRERLPFSKPIAGDVKDQGPAGALTTTSYSNAEP